MLPNAFISFQGPLEALGDGPECVNPRTRGPLRRSSSYVDRPAIICAGTVAPEAGRTIPRHLESTPGVPRSSQNRSETIRSSQGRPGVPKTRPRIDPGATRTIFLDENKRKSMKPLSPAPPRQPARTATAEREQPAHTAVTAKQESKQYHPPPRPLEKPTCFAG